MGMLMTIDGSDDDAIRIQGVQGLYTFNDADGGEVGGESEVEEDEGGARGCGTGGGGGG
jgi:hypothetical protein